MYLNTHIHIRADSETLAAYDFPKHDFLKSFKFWTFELSLPPTQVFIFLPPNSSEISLSDRNKCSAINVHLHSGSSQFLLFIYYHYSNYMKKGEIAKTNSMYGDEKTSIPISFLYYLMWMTNRKPHYHYVIHISTNKGKVVPVHTTKAYMGVEMQLRPFLTFAPDGHECSASCCSCFTNGESDPYLLNRKMGLDTLEKR